MQESHSVANDTNYWKSQWGNTIWLSHGTEHSAGVATLKHKFKGDVLCTECDPNGHFICQALRYNNTVYIICNIYGYNAKQENNNLLISIENVFITWLTKFPNASLLLEG